MSTKRLGANTREISLYLNENIVKEIDRLCEQRNLKSRSELIKKVVCDILSKPLSMEELIELDFITELERDVLIKAINENKKILICGKVASGKTTLIRSLLDKFNNMRIVIANDTTELTLKDNITLKEEQYETILSGGKSYEKIKEALLTSPKIIVTEEVRDKKDVKFVDNVATIASCQASSLDHLAERFGEEFKDSFDYIVFVGIPLIDGQKKRSVQEIVRISRKE